MIAHTAPEGVVEQRVVNVQVVLTSWALCQSYVEQSINIYVLRPSLSTAPHQLPSINNRFLYTARPLLPLSRVFIIGSHKRTAEPPAKRSNSRVSKCSKTEDTSGSERAASSPSLPAKSSGERDEATSQQGGDKSGVAPETSPTLEIISFDEQWKSDNKKELEYHKTDIGV
ncbi:hypothetical protein BFJ68_g6946 [Fusarium oxysporum]|uniref:Uncharacterized protein n=1 Tax=Fusarium oxysporum TaxID=5507 RepID=A0A420QFG0_FUSOX|nr:hypothetical protein BFJ71_g4009 [Fusarium oxysporum]RKL13713.1 hypothetical protein BFJ68_g6946 [Fusarium oxysporum]